MMVFTSEMKITKIIEGLIKTHLIIFIFILVSTESLSIFKAINFQNVFLAWCLFLVSILLMSFRHKCTINLDIKKTVKLSFFDFLIVLAITVILLLTFFTAIIYPPNTHDSLTYHMSRVVHWISNNNVSFYSTAVTRQNYLAPLAEFAIMHLQVLTGSDRFANIVQWMSFFINICLGVLIAIEIRLNKKQQLLTAFFIATIPMAILQASSTQNDLPWVLRTRSFSTTSISVIGTTGRFSWNFCQLAPLSKDTYIPYSVPA